jgi:cytoskeletal protein CcmA (bactofilin family)
MATTDAVHEIQTHSPARPRSDVDERRTTAWIGQGVIIEGRVTSSQDLRIDGKVDGKIEVDNHLLTVGHGAEVKANLVGRSILISGTVVGNVTATVRVDLHATGSVEGDITSPRLVVVDGAFLSGTVNAGDTRTTRT